MIIIIIIQPQEDTDLGQSSNGDVETSWLRRTKNGTIGDVMRPTDGWDGEVNGLALNSNAMNHLFWWSVDSGG